MIHYIQCGNVEVTQIDDELLILNPNNFTITKLNEVGSFCWSLLHDKQSIDSIIEALQAGYQGAEHINSTEIEEYLTDLEKYGLIQYAI